jgi:hypothetical protein
MVLLSDKKQGDFHVALARFRLGGKPDPWAQKVVENVGSGPYARRRSY